MEARADLLRSVTAEYAVFVRSVVADSGEAGVGHSLKSSRKSPPNGLKKPSIRFGKSNENSVG
jgi:hypothetical protein